MLDRIEGELAHGRVRDAVSTEAEPGALQRIAGADEELRTGSQVGRYLVVQRIGAGAMGVVYEAADPQTGERVAVKTINGVTPQAMWRFKQEFRNLSHISHDNLVCLRELFEFGGRHFLTMELIRGDDIVTHVRPDRRVAPNYDRVRRALADLATALTVLHEHGYVHLDVKPTNVMVEGSGRVVLLDFGLSERQILDFEPRHRRLVGSPAYMSPERAGGGGPTPEVDWYAVGVLLFECLTGRLPFMGSASNMTWAKRSTRAPRASSFAPKTPSDLDDLCTRLLDPDPARRANAADIFAVSGSAPSPTSSSDRSSDTWSAQGPMPFVGRAQQLQVLSRTLDRARSGSPALAYIDGPSGVGKSALAREFARRSNHERRCTILEVRCFQSESLPFKTLDNIIDALSNLIQSLEPGVVESIRPPDVLALVRLFPTLGRIRTFAGEAGEDETSNDEEEVRERALAALGDLLANLSALRPMIIIIDDLQWGDLESVWIIEELLAKTPGLRVLVLACVRTGETKFNVIARELATAPPREDVCIEHVELDPLCATEARSLAEAALAELDAPDIDAAERIARESGGLPLFLVELALDSANRTDGGARVRYSTLFDVLASRIGELPASARHVLDVLAISEQPLDAVQLRAASGEVPDIGATTNALTARKLVRLIGTGTTAKFEPLHARIRETAIELMGAAKREQLHADVARALHEHGAPPERLVLHLLAAKREREAGELALLAATRAEEVLAFERAAALYSIARKTLATSDERLRELDGRRGRALAKAGRVHSAANAYLHRRRSKVSGRDHAQRRLAAEHLLQTGHVDEGMAILRMILARHRLPIPTVGRDRPRLSDSWRRFHLRIGGYHLAGNPSARADVERTDACWSAAVGLGPMNPSLGLQFTTRHLQLALALSDPGRAARGLALHAMMSSQLPHLREGACRAMLARATALVGQSEDAESRHLIDAASGITDLCHGELQTAADHLLRTENAVLESHGGHAWVLGQARTHRLIASALLGKIPQLERELPPITADAREHDDQFVLSMVGSSVACLPALASDDPDLAESIIRESSNLLTSQWYTLAHAWALVSKTKTLLYAEDADGLLRLWRSCEPLVAWATRLRSLRPHLNHAAALATVVVARASGSTPSFGAGSRSQIRKMGRSRAATDRTLSCLGQASYAVLRGDVAAAISACQRAELHAAACGMHLHGAAARHRRGELTGGHAGETLIQGSREALRGAGVRDAARYARTMIV